MNNLDGKNIVLGVTGGIAAYKSADLVRRLREAGATVRVIMTGSATRFVTPLTFQALSGRHVHLDLFGEDSGEAMDHIEIARWADVLLVAPASADFIARLAQGRADDLLSATCLCHEGAPALAPAMNRAMWEAAATRENVRVLQERGVHLFGPGFGDQACGETGSGRMLEPADLVERLSALFGSLALAGVRVMVTAGPTREPVDPVRFFSNRSSGRMGFAVARAAREAGAKVVLISGPVELETPRGVQRIDIETAADMHREVLARVPGIDLFIAAAAVADWRPATVAGNKIKKTGAGRELALESTTDVLAEVAALEPGPFTVGFAAETGQLESNARAKLERKGLDMVAANLVGVSDRGFDAPDNALHLFWRDGDEPLPLMSKERLARQLMEIIARRYRAGRSTHTAGQLNAENTAEDS